MRTTVVVVAVDTVVVADTVVAAAAGAVVVATAGKLAPHQDRANFALRIEADAMRRSAVEVALPNR